MTQYDLAPAHVSPSEDAYCPRCAESGEPGEWVPLDDAKNDHTTPRTVPVPADHIQDMGRLFEGAVPLFVTICDRHDLAVVYPPVETRPGWVIVRIETANGLARGWVPEAEIKTRTDTDEQDDEDARYGCRECDHTGNQYEVHDDDTPGGTAVCPACGGALRLAGF